MMAAATGIGKQVNHLPSRRSPGQNARFSGNRHARSTVISQVRVGDVVEVVQNKVLMAAAVSGAIGQLVKPFTRVFLSDKKEKNDLDPWAAIESGGFPSSHSSAVTATTTSLFLERGLADSIFGLSLIYAAIVMYDAQGVRREVGKHAGILNKKHQQTLAKKVQNSCLGSERDKNRPIAKRSDGTASLDTVERRAGAAPVFMVDESRVAADEEEEAEQMIVMGFLKEGVGHTELEVVAGALLGISVSIFVHNLM